MTLMTLSESVEATIDHISTIVQKKEALVARLDAARHSALDQVVHRIADEYRAGSLDTAGLLAAYDRLREAAGGGWFKHWKACDLPDRQRINYLIAEAVGSRPNGPNGSWNGRDAYPTAANPMPPHGQSVVYVLYDETNTPCYVGSSEWFRTRLRTHLRDGKPVAWWSAFPCPDREAAYALEDRLLKQYKPYLNIKACA